MVGIPIDTIDMDPIASIMPSIGGWVIVVALVILHARTSYWQNKYANYTK